MNWPVFFFGVYMWLGGCFHVTAVAFVTKDKPQWDRFQRLSFSIAIGLLWPLATLIAIFGPGEKNKS